MAPLIPSAENGLFSRQVFYYMPGVKEFISQFQSNDRELVSHFKRLGAYYSRYHRLLMASGNYQLKLSRAQQVYNWRDKGLLQATAVHGGFQKQAIE